MPDPRGSSLPVLWHLKVSNYNEKARWALDYKHVAHARRAVVPGRHQAVARKLTGGSTFPVLVLDGHPIGDTTAIIAALEERHPDRPLYPSDPVERRRALELEDFFDEQLGPYSRLLALHHMLPDADLMLGAFVPDLSGVPRALARAGYPMLRRRVVSDYGIDGDSVRRAFAKLRAAGDAVSGSLRPIRYLVGDTFTVADLTLAALVAPLVAPEQFPYPQPQRGHPRLQPVRDALAASGLLDWTHEMYARHRGASAEATPPRPNARGSR